MGWEAGYMSACVLFFWEVGDPFGGWWVMGAVPLLRGAAGGGEGEWPPYLEVFQRGLHIRLPPRIRQDQILPNAAVAPRGCGVVHAYVGAAHIVTAVRGLVLGGEGGVKLKNHGGVLRLQLAL
eukprot:scaffold11074_cov70-Isochrysis_galbana.AAC.2